MQNALCELFPADLLHRHKQAGPLSHSLIQELRSPLCAITLSLGYVKNKISSDQAAAVAHLELVERNAERMARILDLFEEREFAHEGYEYP